MRFYIPNNQPTRGQIESALSDFAELLSRGFGINEAADAMEVTRGTGCVLYRWLCEYAGEVGL